jgi:inorganic triphosphatase YgiF
MAYDYGEIIHGTDDTQRDAIQEVEFELIAGELDFLFTTAKTWCQRHKLCLSTVTKAERGGLLIKGQNYSSASAADLSTLSINKKITMPAFLRAVVHNCLLQILPNSSAIVAGSKDDSHLLKPLIASQMRSIRIGQPYCNKLLLYSLIIVSLLILVLILNQCYNSTVHLSLIGQRILMLSKLHQ